MLLYIKGKLNNQRIEQLFGIFLHHMASSGFDGSISWHLIGQIGRNHVTMNHKNHTGIIENESP